MKKSLLILFVVSFGGCDPTHQPASAEKNSAPSVKPAPTTQESAAGSGFGNPPFADLAAEVQRVRKAAEDREEKLYAEFATRNDAVKSEADQEALDRWRAVTGVELQTVDRAAIRTLMPLLQGSVADPASVRGLLYAVDSGDDADRAEAGRLLHQHHLSRPEVLALAEGPWGLACEDWVEPLIRSLLADGAAPVDRRSRLRIALGIHLKEKAETARVAGRSEYAARYGPERIAQIRKRDVAKLEATALELFDKLVADGVPDEFLLGVTVADAARLTAHELRNLAVGKKAPEIAGEDLYKRPMRLSDYRGKVLVLSFWHSRCTPCLDFTRHERKLVERFAGRPFAPVGINVDEDRDAAKMVVENQKLLWRSFWSGPKGCGGEIPRAWNVQSFPTIYVIDHTGMIRSKTARGAELDQLLDELVKKSESDAGK